MSAAVLAAAIVLNPVDPTVAAAHIPKPLQAYATCVEHRESRGNPQALNSTGHAGLYQFAQAWRHGLPYMVRDRLVQFGMPAKAARAVRVHLQRLPIHHWPAKYQRIGFLEVLERGGYEHWHIGGSRCNGLAP